MISSPSGIGSGLCKAHSTAALPSTWAQALQVPTESQAYLQSLSSMVYFELRFVFY